MDSLLLINDHQLRLPRAAVAMPTQWLMALCSWLLTLPEVDAKPDAYTLVGNSCLDCHDDKTQKGGIRLDDLDPISEDPVGMETWLKVYDQVASGSMPPDNKSFSSEEIENFTSILGEELTSFDAEKQRTTGRVVARRLSSQEYENIIRDLLFLPHLSVSQYLPADTKYHGITNVASRQDLAYNQIAQYLEAAEASLQAAVLMRPRPESETKRYEPTRLGAHSKVFNSAHVIAEKKLVLIKEPVESQGPWTLFTSPRTPGYYTIRVRLKSSRIHNDAFTGNPHPQPSPKLLPGKKNQTVALGVALGRFLESFDVTPKGDTYEATVWLHGTERLSLHCADLPFRDTKFVGGKKPEIWDAVAIEWAEIDGPIIEHWPPRSHQALLGTIPLKRWSEKSGLQRPRNLATGTGQERRIFDTLNGKYFVDSMNPASDSARLLRRFMKRAYRRPVTEDEVAEMQGIVLEAIEKKICFQDAMLVAYKAILCSPDFLFVTEQPGKLSGNEISTRLALYLWRSLPDKRLIELGRSGELLKPDVLRAESKRMINDPRANRFIDDFTNQWLDLRSLYSTAPDKKLYPEYSGDASLVESLAAETRAYVREMVHKDLPVAAIVDSDFTFINQKLAVHYGIPGIEGSQLRRVSLPTDSVRGGILTQGSMMKISANGFTTSPINRGVWVLERILGKHPPPPPPDAGSVEPDTRGAITIRDQLAKHSEIESCASCHLMIDPPGFALESFDIMGGYRTHYRSIAKGKNTTIDRGNFRYPIKLGLPVDASGEFEGSRFSDIQSFKDILIQKDRQIARNILKRLLIHSTGAIATYSDRAIIEQLLDEHASDGYGMQSLILSLLETPMFLQR
ncbi:MAG: DUF1592 domain-containing protein [Verrucomicrobiota bacterium]